MPTFRVATYVLSRGAMKSPGNPPFRWHSIILVPDGSNDSPANDAVVLFTPNPSLGNTHTAKRVTVYMPPEEFEHYHRILQTESPVFAEWTVDGNGQLTSFYLKTREEPVGEGPVDNSDG